MEEREGWGNKKGLFVKVHNNDIDGAINALKKKINQEGITRELRQRKYYEKPSEKNRRKRAEARLRWLKKISMTKQSRY